MNCDPKDYTEIMIIPDEIITPEFGFQLNVGIIEVWKKSCASIYQYEKFSNNKYSKRTSHGLSFLI